MARVAVVPVPVLELRVRDTDNGFESEGELDGEERGDTGFDGVGSCILDLEVA